MERYNSAEVIRHQQPNELIAWGKRQELVLLYQDDPEYAFRGNDLDALFGFTGLVKRVRKQDGTPLVERANAFGKYDVADGFSLDGVLGDTYRRVDALTFKREEDRPLFSWEPRQVVARFDDFRELYDAEAIVPEFNDTMIPLPLSKGCKRSCTYCPEAGGLVTYSATRIAQSMLAARAYELKHHGAHLDRMNELFLDSSDLLWFNGKEPRPVDIVRLAKQIFPEAQKLYAFFGLPNTLATPIEELKALRQAGLYSALVGVESFHEPTSKFLGKPESTRDKVEAIKKIRRAAIKPKLIVQVGMVGDGFTDGRGRFHSSKEGLEESARTCAELIGSPLERAAMRGPKPKVLVSAYTPAPGTPLARLHAQGRFVTPYDSPTGLAEDIAFFLQRLQAHGADIHDQKAVETGYEVALQTTGAKTS